MAYGRPDLSFDFPINTATLRVGDQCIQMNWLDEPNVWKDLTSIDVRHGPIARQLGLLEQAMESEWRRGNPRAQFRIGVCRLDGGWNGVPSVLFDPDDVLSDPAKVRAFPRVYDLHPVIDGEARVR